MVYPKQRPALPPEYQAIYAKHYAENRAGNGVANSMAQRLEAWMHRRVASRRRDGEDLLDFGAGNLNHLPYEHGYATYDIVEPFKELYADQPGLAQVTQVYDLAKDVDGKTYNRVFSIAVLEHLTDLPEEVAKCADLLKPNGIFQAGIPCEGELAWTLGWMVSTGVAFNRKYGLDYGVLMRHEHVNTYREIIEVLRARFSKVTIQRSPFPFPLPHASFYAYVEAEGPRSR